MKNSTLTILALGCLLAGTVETAFGQGTIYISRPAFQSALSSSTTINFEGLPTTPSGGIGESGITNSGVTFVGGSLFIRDSFSPVPATGKYLHHFDSPGPVTISLPGGITAFGADFSSQQDLLPSYNPTWTVNLVGGQAYTYNLTGQAGFWSFFGVTFPQPIGSLIFSDGGPVAFGLHNETLDNVTIGVVPEPSVFALIGLGALLFGWRLRKRI